MKNYLILFLSILSLAAGAGELPGWKLVWADEFSEGTGPNTKYWGCETGILRNREAQLYTARKENLRIENGCLVIEGRKEKIPNPQYQKGSADWNKVEFAQYTSASISTYQRIHWLYGRIEIRAKLPKGIGTWPAIWMMGGNNFFERSKISTPPVSSLPIVWESGNATCQSVAGQTGWPACGEIDIMEHVGKDPLTIVATCHWQDGTNNQHRAKSAHIDNARQEETYDDFHIYAIEWDADHIKFFYDDRLYFTYDVALADQPDGSNPFRLPQYLKLNLALGGSWGGPVIDESQLPARYWIDYVRVYQRP